MKMVWMMKRNLVAWLSVSFVLVLLTACGGNAGGSAGESSAGGGNGGPRGTLGNTSVTNVEKDRVEFEMTTSDGQQLDLTATSGVPEDFPLPVYPEWKVMGGVAKADLGDGVRWNGGFEFEGDVKELAQRYAEDLRAIGYEVEVIDIGSMTGLEVTGTLDGRPAEGIVSIGVAGDKSIININFGHR